MAEQLSAAHRAPRRRFAGRLVLLLAVLLVLAAGWLLVTGWLAGAQLQDADSALKQARVAAVDQRLPAAAAQVTEAQRAAHRAHRLTSGPVWWTAGRLPWIGRTPRAASTAALAADRLTGDVLPVLVQAAETASPNRLRTSGTSLDLAPLTRVAPALAVAARQVDDVQRVLEGTGRGSGVLAPVAQGLDDFRAAVADLSATVHGAALAAELLPPMLGANGPRSYLLAFQNPAEARGTGGLVGGYGVLKADHGKLSVQTLGTDSDLTGLKKLPPELGSDYEELWGQDPALWVNSNESPHFPYGAQIWLDAWQAQHGQRLDGVLALDPEVLSYLLSVTGPVTLPDGERITAANVVQQTMQAAYVRFAKNPNARKAYLTVVAGAVVQRLLGQRDDPAALVRALGRGVAERRVLVYSDHAEEQRALAGQAVAGALPDAQGANVLVAVNNAAGNKLDYYLDRRISYAGTACAVGGMRSTQVDLTLTNTVDKAAALPDYVVGVLGSQARTPARRNDNKTIAGFWLPPGAQVQQVTVDGRPAEFNLGTEVGHPVVLTTVTLRPRRPVHVSVRLREPATADAPTLAVQPLVRPAGVAVTAPTCH